MFRASIFLLLLFLIQSCAPDKLLPEPRTQYMRRMTHYNDSCSDYCSRWVFSYLPCDSIVYTHGGNTLNQVNTSSAKDSSCFTCSDNFNSGSALLNSFVQQGKHFHYLIYGDGKFLIYGGEGCDKKEIDFKSKFPDSVSVVFWQDVKADSMLTFYAAEESFEFPYYKQERIDSYRYNLNRFCSQEEIEEKKKEFQDLVNTYMEVHITPNPYVEAFELRLNCKKLCGLFLNTVKTLTFYDEQGNTKHSQTINTGETYAFSFPEMKSGQLLFYRITWSDYSLSGSILKS